MVGHVSLDTSGSSSTLGVYWAYGKVLKGGPHFETEKGKAVSKGCGVQGVVAAPVAKVEKPQQTAEKCWSVSYRLVRGDGGNDGVNDVDAIVAAMAAGGPTCGEVGWVGLVVSAKANNGPKGGDAIVGALKWQRYRVHDEYAESADKFTRDLDMTPKGTDDIMDSSCMVQEKGGLSCSFSKRLLTQDQYDVKSESNQVFLVYGGFDGNRKRVVAKTVLLGE